MIDFFRTHFSSKKSPQDKLEKETTEQQSEEEDTMPSPLTPQVYCGLPEDFWPILAKLPFDFSSNEVPRIRKGREYQEKLLEYLKQPQNNASTLKQYQTQEYQEKLLEYFKQPQNNASNLKQYCPQEYASILKKYGERQNNNQTYSNTSIESQEELQEGIILTSNLRP